VDDRAVAQSAVSLALEGQGLRVVEHGDVVHDDDACASIDCASEILRAARADLAAAVAVWGVAGRPLAGPSEVFVTLADAHGNRFPGAARVVDGDVAAAARTAVLDARALQLLGPGPWLRVRGAPDGAEVHIDGKLAGSLPYRAHIDAGGHALEVRAPGMRPHARTVDIPPNTTRLLDLDITLALDAPGGAASGRSGARHPGESSAEDSNAAVARSAPTSPSLREGAGGGTGAPVDPAASGPSRPIVGPLVLGGAGAALGVIVVADLLADDCTRGEPGGTCTRREDPSIPLAIGLGTASAAAIAGAVLWHFLGASDPSAAAARGVPATAGARMIRVAAWPPGATLTGAF
jgi:hypothetical protein